MSTQSLDFVPWLTTLVGVLATLFFYLRGRNQKRLAHQIQDIWLIGGGGPENVLPDEVKVTVAGVDVPRLSKATVVLWNAGNLTIARDDIVESDPLRLEVGDGAQIIDARIVQATRPVIEFQLAASEDPRVRLCVFNFLDQGDGVVVDLLHTGVGRITVKGTVKGMPKGLLDLGNIPPITGWRRRRRLEPTLRWVLANVMSPRTLLPVTAIVALISVAVWLFPVVVSFVPALAKPSAPPMIAGNPDWPALVIGVPYAGLAIFVWKLRRRHPRALSKAISERTN